MYVLRLSWQFFIFIALVGGSPRSSMETWHMWFFLAWKWTFYTLSFHKYCFNTDCSSHLYCLYEFLLYLNTLNSCSFYFHTYIIFSSSIEIIVILWNFLFLLFRPIIKCHCFLGILNSSLKFYYSWSLPRSPHSIILIIFLIQYTGPTHTDLICNFF